MCISKTLAVNESIVHLNLSGNMIGDDSCLALMEALRSNFILKELVLSGCCFGLKAAESLVQVLGVSKNMITKVDLSKNDLDDRAIVALGGVLGGTNRKLVDLNLSENRFGAAGGASIFAALERRNLEKLDMSGNALNVIESFGLSRRLPLSLKSFKIMMTSLPTMLAESSLIELNLSRCNLGDGLATAVAKVVKESDKVMQKIYVGNNGITSVGAKKIVAALMDEGGCDWIKELDLGGNLLGFNCCLEVIDCIAKCKQLDLLGIEGCWVAGLTVGGSGAENKFERNWCGGENFSFVFLVFVF